MFFKEKFIDAEVWYEREYVGEYRIKVRLTYKGKTVRTLNFKCDKFLRMIKSDLPPVIVPTSNLDLKWAMIGCIPTKDKSAVEKSFRKMSMIYHPDQGGNADYFKKLCDARDEILKTL